MQKELEIASAEMDRAQHRLVMLEREKEALKQQVITFFCVQDRNSGII